jgi:hypothetical protein
LRTDIAVFRWPHGDIQHLSTGCGWTAVLGRSLALIALLDTPRCLTDWRVARDLDLPNRDEKTIPPATPWHQTV